MTLNKQAQRFLVDTHRPHFAGWDIVRCFVHRRLDPSGFYVTEYSPKRVSILTDELWLKDNYPHQYLTARLLNEPMEINL